MPVDKRIPQEKLKKISNIGTIEKLMKKELKASRRLKPKYDKAVKKVRLIESQLNYHGKMVQKLQEVRDNLIKQVVNSDKIENSSKSPETPKEA